MRGNNDKRFTVKLLGVFHMDTENFSPIETRKTIKCVALWLIAIISVYKLFGLLSLIFQAA